MFQRPAPKFLVLFAMLFAAPLAAAEYEIAAKVWIDGELRGTPILVVEPGNTASVEVASGAVGWRLSVLVEPPSAAEGADPGGIWMVVGLDQKAGDDWEHLTETLIGTPLGEPGRISVVAPGAPADAPPEQAQLYVELVAREIEAADAPDD